MRFCILYCEFKESDYLLSDSFYYFLLEYTDLRGFSKYSGIGDDLSSFLDEFDCSIDIFTISSYKIISKVLTSNNFSNVNLYTLSSFVGLPETFGLYEIFSHYFYSEEFLPTDKMLDVILTSIVTCNKDLPFTYCMFLKDADGCYTFSWFQICENSSIKVLGNDFLEIQHDEFDMFRVGQFMKCLRYKMAETDCCYARTKFITWDCSSITPQISKYILGYSLIKKFFDGVDGLRGRGWYSTLRLLDNTIRLNYKYTTTEFLRALSCSSKQLQLGVDTDGSILCASSFSKDYSKCNISEIETSRCRWGIIIDCEGAKNNGLGLRELGGLIFCRYESFLICSSTFECTELLLGETILQVIRDYEESSGRYIPSRGIDIFTFGGTDKCMLEYSLQSAGLKQVRKKVKKLFRYYDCRDYILSYFDFIFHNYTGKRTLSEIGRKLEVYVHQPKHSALADAKTLFNVLSVVLQETRYWILDK